MQRSCQVDALLMEWLFLLCLFSRGLREAEMRYLVNWVLTQCGAPEAACRAQCMTLFMQLAPVQQGLSVLCLSVCVVSICSSLPLVWGLSINYVHCMYMYTACMYVCMYMYAVCACTLYVHVRCLYTLYYFTVLIC